MNLKTNVTRRDFAFSVTAETKVGELRMFDHTVDAESEEAARLLLISYLESRGMELVDARLTGAE